jgi:ribonuclease HI
VAEAEAKACLLGMQSIQDVKNASINLKSDNSAVVEAIKRKNQGRSRL